MEKEPVTSKDLTPFVYDGKNIIGVKVSETDDTVVIRDPLCIFLAPVAGSDQLQVQFFPFWFGELLTEQQRDKGIEWNFARSSVVMSELDIELDDKVVAQYNRAFGLIPQSKIITPAKNPNIVKLFDD